ncbi:MAG: TolC family protein [Bacteroidales bacterium]|nr:TolC family protein [Bacteroidales bacterium]
MNLRAFLLLLIIAGISNIYAQTDSVYSFNLPEAQEYAISNFHMSKNAELDIESAKWKVWETTAIGLPQVNASAAYQHIPGEIPKFEFSIPGMDTLGIDFGEPAAIAVKNSVTYGFTVSQLIFSGEYLVGLQASRVYKSLSEETYDKTEIGIKQSVAESYFTILLLEKNRTILNKTLDNLRLNLFQVQKSFEAGLIEDTEVDQIDLVVKRTENDLASLNRQFAFMARMFKYQIGLEPSDSLVLTDDIDNLVVANIVNDEAYRFVLENNIDFRMLETQEKLMQLNMRREKSKYLPVIAGFYQYQDKTNKPDFDFTIKHIIGLSVEIPIVTSGMRVAKVSQARIEYEKAQNTKNQEINRLMMEAEQALFDYRTAVEKYHNEKLNFDLSEKVYNKTMQRYKEGFVSSLDLTLINNQYLQAQLTYSLAVQELLSAKIKMDKAYNLL